MDKDDSTAGSIAHAVLIVPVTELCLYIIAQAVKFCMMKNKDGLAAKEEYTALLGEPRSFMAVLSCVEVQ